MTGDTGNRQGTLPEEELTLLLGRVAAGENWRAVLDSLDLPTLSKKRNWFLDAHKGDFYRSLSVRSRDWAMDLGAGAGVIASELANDYRHVIALEHHPLWSRFIARRLAQDARAGTGVVRGNALRLPCRDASMDLVVLNGVLEWVPEAAAPDVSPRRAQLECLREIRRVLGPGGALGIAIENRWHFRHLLGASPHGEPRFAAVLPRSLAERVTRGRQGRSYRTWIYGAGGYRSLLREAGFGDITVRGAMPTYHEPRAAVDLAERELLRPYFASQRPARAMVFSLLGRLGLLGRLVHSFYIGARPG